MSKSDQTAFNGPFQSDFEMRFPTDSRSEKIMTLLLKIFG